MSRLWNLFRPAPPDPLEGRVVPAATAPLIDAAAVDRLLGGPAEASLAPGDEAVAEAEVGPPAQPEPGPEAPPGPEPIAAPPDWNGAFRGEVTFLSPAAAPDGARGLALSGAGSLLGSEGATLEGMLLYDSPGRPPSEPRATGSLVVASPIGTLHLRIESRERSGSPSLLFPTAFRLTVEGGSGAYEHLRGEPDATLVFPPHRGRRAQPARPVFQLAVRGSA